LNNKMSMKKIFIAGHMGMVGGAICKKLASRADIQILTRTRTELDLCDQEAVFQFMRTEQPDEIIMAAAKVGGIYANNKYPADFIYQNLQIQNNILHAAHLNDVHKLLFLGSSCIYPREVSQPMQEDALLSGALEPTNEPYAIAKIAGIKMCESYNRQYGRDYRSVMPTNLYGPGDKYHPSNSHVVPALIRRFYEARINGDDEVIVWGSGTPRREFLFVDDMAEACLLIHELKQQEHATLTTPMQSHINVGAGSDVTINELAKLVKTVTGFPGRIVFDKTKPDGAPRKLLDVSKLQKLGWSSKTSLESGLKAALADYAKHNKSVQSV
jgi:GDP-L-fucose synthase